jgi:hypothetical protein
MLVCPQDGRHIRAFISDREFVEGVVEKVSIRADSPDSASTGSTGTKGRETRGDAL